MKLGFIGQGWIGKNYADHFEERGFSVVRYSLELPYLNNKKLISDCDVVFIAVPTPTTGKGFDISHVSNALKNVGIGKIAVIKSTIIPGTTRKLQKKNKKIKIIYSPEFLRESSARFDVDHPDRNIIGIPVNASDFKLVAKKVLKILPKASYNKICTSDEAELTKYGGNIFLYWKIVFANMLFDLAKEYKSDWDTIVENMSADPRVGKSHWKIEHKSNHLSKKGGRGAGGHCFIKDFVAFRKIYQNRLKNDKFGLGVLLSLESKNLDLLKNSKKDLDLVASVYGKYF